MRAELRVCDIELMQECAELCVCVCMGVHERERVCAMGKSECWGEE